MTSKYTYPDPNDAATLAFTRQESQWEQEENQVFLSVKNDIKNGELFIDAGCGLGRLIPMFAPRFDQVVAIEPDAQRIEAARAAINMAHLAKKVQFVQSSVQDLEICFSADFILSSHIIQHISILSIPLMLQKLNYLLKPEGTLLITTNYSSRDQDYFTQSYVENGESREEEISEPDFEALIGTQTGMVPVHHFTKHSLIDLIQSAGMQVRKIIPFHFNPSLPNGRDVLILVGKI